MSVLKFSGRIVSALIFIFVVNVFAKDSLILCNDNGIVNDRAIGEIEKIGDELKQKTNIAVYLCVKKTINHQKIKDFEKSLLGKMKRPFILLTLAVDDQKVDIYTSNDTKKLVDVDAVLSPFSGTVIPILTSRKGSDKYSAAMLNGYADITDRVANSMGIKLNSSVGNTNRILVNILRVVVYGSFLYFMIMYFRKRYKKKK
ncbi:MAG: TPM domain-containing protein [Epsilonproteobacteria bacterium]|nr:TPM domain-containing protein [Campylobacterota bacterium]